MTNKKTRKTFLTLFILIIVLIIPYFVFAQAPLDAVKNVVEEGSGINPDPVDLEVYLGTIVSVFMGLLGVIFIILMIYGGFSWMRAGGDESKVELAINTIKRAVIGLLIVVGSYAIAQFIFSKLLSN